MNDRRRWAAPRIRLVRLDVARLIADEFGVIPEFCAGCLRVYSVREIRIIGVGNPVLNATKERPLIVQRDVHIAVPRTYLDPHR